MNLVRTTPEFDESTVPAGLLGEHRVAPGVWGRLIVRAGALGFGFEGRPERVVPAGEHVAIPPDVTHHVRIVGPVRFVVEFHRPGDRTGRGDRRTPPGEAGR